MVQSTARSKAWALAVTASEAALALLGLWTVWRTSTATIDTLVVWDGLVVAYLITGFVRIRRQRHAEFKPGPQAPGRDQYGFASGLRALGPVVVSMVGLVSSLTVLLAKEPDPDAQIAVKAVGVLSMILAWLMLHVSYARRYEWVYQHASSAGLDFPSTPDPVTIDFLYFALTLGTTFATSDVNVTTRRMRWHVIVHSVLGFFYNAVVMAIAFKILTGG